mgnify:FL=1
MITHPELYRLPFLVVFVSPIFDMNGATLEQVLPQLIELITVGLQGHRAKEANAKLEQLKSQPWFIGALNHIFSLDNGGPPLVPAQAFATFGWSPYRQMAGVILKNSIKASVEALGGASNAPSLLAPIAQTATRLLTTSTERRITSTAAQLVAKVTSMCGVAWWAQVAQVDLPSLLLGDMLGPNSNDQSKETALLAIEYLLEDASASIGETCFNIIYAISDVCVHPQTALALRRKAIAALTYPYEIGARMDWNVENLQPFQLGLCRAVVRVVEVVSMIMSTPNVDLRVAQLCLRGCTLSLDYTSYVGQDLPRFVAQTQNWIPAVLHFAARQPSLQCQVSQDGSLECDVACEALDLVESILSFDQRCGANDDLRLVAAIEHALPQLMPLVFQAAVMRDAELQSLLEGDSPTCRDPPRPRRAGQTKNRAGRSAGADADDDDSAKTGATLRDSAGRLLDQLALGHGSVVFGHVLNFAQNNFSAADWRLREVTFLALGSVAEGCQRQMEPYLPVFIPQLCATASDPNNKEPVAVRSMALWTISQYACWLFESPAPRVEYIAGVVNCLLSGLSFPSKRVQWASISALRQCVRNALRFDPLASSLSAHLGSVFTAITACCNVFHGNNLAVLCDLTIEFIPLMNEQTVGPAVQPFFVSHDAALGQLAQTLEMHYKHDQPVDVVLDAFEHGRVLVCAFQCFPPAFGEHPQQLLQVYLQIVNTVGSYKVTDNLDIQSYPLHLAWQLQLSLTTQALAAFTTTTSSALLMAAVESLKSGDNEAAIIGCSILSDHVNRLGVHGIGGGAQFICSALVPHLHFTETPWLACEAATLLEKLILVYTQAEGQCHCADSAVPLIVAQVRGDTYDNQAMDHFAVAAAALLVLRPQCATVQCVHEIALAQKNLPNDEPKAKGTKSLATAIATSPNVTMDPSWQRSVEAFVRLLVSWQREGQQYDNFVATVRAALAKLQALHAGFLKHVMDSLPASNRVNLNQLFGM